MLLEPIVRCWILGISMVIHGLPAFAAPAMSLAPASFALASTDTTARGHLVLSIDGITDPNAQQKDFVQVKGLDQASPATTVVTFETPVYLQGGKSQHQWLLGFSVVGMPAGQTQTRFLNVTMKGESQAVAYQLVTPAVAPVTWALKLPPAASRAVDSDELMAGLPVIITKTGSGPIKGLEVGPTEMRDASTQKVLAWNWDLIPAPAASAPAAPNPSRWLLKPRDAASIRPGKFEGSVTVISDDKPSGETANLTLYVSAWYWKALGAALILGSTLIGLWFTQFLRFRSNRDQMLLPAVLVRDGVHRLMSELRTMNAPPLKMPCITARLGALQDALSATELENNGLPAMPSPWGSSTNSAATTERFRVYVQTQADWLHALESLVAQGIRPLCAERPKNPAAASDIVFEQCIASIDALANDPTPPGAATIGPVVQKALTDYRGALSRNFTAVKASMTGATTVSQQVKKRIVRTNLLGWGVLGLITTCAGIYILVLQNPGFGTCLDLGACLLWGLGLPTGTALAGVTVGSVATTFNIAR